MIRTLLSIALLVWAEISPAHPTAGSYVLLQPQEARLIRKLEPTTPATRGLLELIRERADSTMKLGPWSVTFYPSKAPSGDPHDYYSEAPYWWPDPKNPEGPYIRRDGETNPNRFVAHKRALLDMVNSVLTLSTAWYVLDDTRYARRAAELVRVWFVDPKTRMNPHLEYAQAIPGRNTGRHSGIIDTRHFVWLLQGLALLREWPGLPDSDRQVVDAWFRQFVDWLMASKHGQREKAGTNNHATWWTAQMMAIASYLGDTAAVRAGCEHFRNHLVPTQIQPDGSCPRELARTRSLHYSAMNLDAYTVICRIARNWGEDLYSFALPNGASVPRAIDFVLPYVLEPSKWRWKQIRPFRPQQQVFMALAGLDLQREDLLRHYLRLPRGEYAIYPLLELVVRARLSAGSRR